MNLIERYNVRWMRRTFPQVADLPDEQLAKLYREAVERADRAYGAPITVVALIIPVGGLILSITGVLQAAFQLLKPAVEPIMAILPRPFGVFAILLLALTPIGVLAVWLVSHSVRLAVFELCQHLCPACGYDLTANASGVCPECGRAVERQET